MTNVQEPGEAADTLRELGHVCCQHLSFVLPQTEFRCDDVCILYSVFTNNDISTIYILYIVCRYEPHEPSLELLAGSHTAAPSTSSTAGSFV